MSKLKFFGCALMAVLFAFSMASCEEENFKTEVDSDVTLPPINIPGVPEDEIPSVFPDYEQGDAVIYIKPTVWAFINGGFQRVTADATIKFNGIEKKEYAETSATGFAAMNIKVTADYVVTVGEETITLHDEDAADIPALKAGQVWTWYPTLIVSYKSDIEGGDTPSDPDTPGTPGTPGGPYLSLTKTETLKPKKYHCDVENRTNFWFPEMTVTSNDKYILDGTYVLEKDIDIINKDYAADAQKFIDAANIGTKKALVWEKVTVYASSVTCIQYQIETTKKYYTVHEGTSSSRAAGDRIATFVVYDDKYQYLGTEYGIALPNQEGHGHGAGSVGHNHGHGNAHDHGHGGENAGGGIVSPL